jgi:hydroxyacylglutathione hydrolase
MLQITPLPAFEDNYIWLLTNPDAAVHVAVDPGDETPVLSWLQEHGGSLAGILITHHHYDHIGGVPELLVSFPGIPVFGPAKSRINGVNRPVREGEQIEIPGLGSRFTVMELPGHTAGHVAYLTEQALFCGDTLFAGGCGRVFDGTFEQLSASLRRIATLPSDTLIYCAHEYTLANLGFAAWVEPDSQALLRRTREERMKRKRGESTLPSRLDLELATNPFLRTAEPGVIQAAERYAGRPLPGHSAVFTALRTWKDREYD